MSKQLAGNERYKVRALKVYGQDGSIFGGQRDYRKIYDQSTSTYINAELTFYNKLFDEEDWETDVLIKGLDIYGKVLCELKAHVKANKTDDIIYVRQGWGTDTPGYWKAGTYSWRAFIDEVQVAETSFSVVNKGVVTPENNPYFSLNSLRLFAGPGVLPAAADRKYLKAFNRDSLAYLWYEIQLESKVPTESIPIEFIVRYYYDTGQLKGEIPVFKVLETGSTSLEMCEGWGTEKPGGWGKDKYTIEIDCMGSCIAILPFEVGSEDIAYDGQPFTAAAPVTAVRPAEVQQSFEDAVKELHELIGLGSVKEQVQELATYLKFVKLRKERGLEDSGRIDLNAMFTGNPGTGKTTVARMLGKIYKNLNLLSKGHVHEVDRAALVAKYIGQTAPMVKQAIETARGGILFVDEAYALTNKGEEDFGREAIEILLKEMSDGPGNLSIVFAGYPGPMREFLNANPGLKSRINSVFDFPDYTPDELSQIATYSARKQGMTITAEAHQTIHEYVVEAYRNRTDQFGNARLINSIIGEAKMNLGKRIMKVTDLSKLDDSSLSTITFEDVQEVFRAHGNAPVELPIDQALLNEAMTELGQLTGIASVKHEIDETVKLVRYYRETGRDLRKAFSMNIVFTGNPGTGKTTIARILIKIYKALGILERGHLVEVDRERLVAGYIGQTAIKTAALIEQAMGGGLFIDEAYALAREGNDFGQEAIETLLKRMEDSRGKFAVIAAGYPDEMETLLQSNPGLKSRFDKTISFPDYDATELWQIALAMFSRERVAPNAAAAMHLKNYLSYLCTTRNRFFGNARAVRKVVEDVVKKQNLRMAELPVNQRTPEMIGTVTLADVEHLLETKEAAKNKTTIGFTAGA